MHALRDLPYRYDFGTREDMSAKKCSLFMDGREHWYSSSDSSVVGNSAAAEDKLEQTIILKDTAASSMALECSVVLRETRPVS